MLWRQKSDELLALAGDLKRLIRRVAESGKHLDEQEIWHYFLQVGMYDAAASRSHMCMRAHTRIQQHLQWDAHKQKDVICNQI